MSRTSLWCFVPGLAQIYQFCEILQRALDLGWTEMLTPLPFHGQRPPEDVKAVFADPSVLAATGSSIHLVRIRAYMMQNHLRSILCPTPISGTVDGI